MKDILEKIRVANLKRKTSNLTRRMLKLSEENGEAAQALLSVTSKTNSKNKTWDDVREELTDVAIVAIDMLLTRFPDEEALTPEEKAEKIHLELDRKLQKWIDKTEKKTNETD